MAEEDRMTDGPEESEEAREAEESGGQTCPADESVDSAQAASEQGPITEDQEFDFGDDAEADTDVFDMLRATIGLFAQEAWIGLGVQARYGSSETRVDLRCARTAIDTTRMLVEQLGDEASEQERREFDQLLTNLRINFVRRKSAVNEGSAETT